MKVLLLVLGVIVVTAAGALFWLGAFAAVEITEREAGPYPFVYIPETSTDVGRIGEITQALGERLERAGFTQRRPAQVLYPAGRGIPNQIGFVVDGAVSNEVLGPDTFFRPIPVQRYMAATLPFRNRLSFMIGDLRVEPALREYRAARKYADTSTMVILEGDSILYLHPVEPA